MAAAELARRGWHLKEEGITGLGSKGNVDSIIKNALDTDFKEVGAAWLSDDINRGRLDYVEGPGVLQVSKLRIVSAPKENEDSQTAPKIYRLSLTDGHVTCSAVTLEPIKGVGLTTPPGTKLLLSGTIEVETNFLLLTTKNTLCLGGRVSNLADSWELKKTLAKQSQTRGNLRGEGGPPPFVPFGKHISQEQLPPPKKDNFRSLASSKEKKISEGDDEFQQQRQAALNEALQAKVSSRGGKTFGGAKFLVNDRDVARITEMGFSASEATSALKISAGNVGEAINSLLSGGQRFQRGGDRGRPGNHSGGADGRSEGRGRRGRDRDTDYDGEDPVNSRPSGPATLFDFLETKIPTKDESRKSYKSSDTKTQSLPTSSALSNDSPVKFYKDNGNDRSQRRPPSKGFESSSSGQFQGRSSYAENYPGYQESYRRGKGENSDVPSGYQNSYRRGKGENSDGATDYEDSYKRGKGENSFNSRGQQSTQQQQQQQQYVPPRFAKLGRGDGQRPGGWNDGGAYRGGGGERYNGIREGGYNNRYDAAYPDKNRAPFRENSYNEGGKGAQSFSGPSREDKSQSFSVSPREDKSQSYSSSYREEKAQSYRGVDPQDKPPRSSNEKFSSDDRRKPSNLSVDIERNAYKDQSGRKDDASSDIRKQNFGNGQYRSSSRSDCQEGIPQPYKGQTNNRFPNQQTALLATPYSPPAQEPPTSQVTKQGYVDRQFALEGNVQVNVGDTCLARYWEDKEFYQASVDALAPDGSTAVVTFMEYGNQEEVRIEDIQPLQQPGWAYQVQAPVYGVTNVNTAFQDPSSYHEAPAYVPPMEFTRGATYYSSSNSGGRRQDYNDRFKPTQARYLPPNQRPH